MSEFKLAPEFLVEIESFASSGKVINDAYVQLEEGTLSTLPTGRKYLRQHEQIKQLLDTYIELVYKDANDLMEMYKAATGMDTNIANAYRE